MNNHESHSEHATNQLGFWSAVLVTFFTALFFLSLVTASTLTLMYAASFLLAPAFVAMMVSIYHYAAADKKVWGHLGLSFAVIYAVLCSLTYYIQLTVIRYNHLQMSTETLLPFVFIPGTPLFSQDILGYAFMCAATLSVAPVFSGGNLENWIRRLFILNGVLFAIPGLFIPAIPLPVNETGTGLGDQVGVYANLVWAVIFMVSTALVAVLFRRQAARQAESKPITESAAKP